MNATLVGIGELQGCSSLGLGTSLAWLYAGTIDRVERATGKTSAALALPAQAAGVGLVG